VPALNAVVKQLMVRPLYIVVGAPPRTTTPQSSTCRVVGTVGPDVGTGSEVDDPGGTVVVREG
jgi:hypothetical protein